MGGNEDMMADAFIYDAVRTPRGRGRVRDGALAEVSPLDLAATVLGAVRDRSELDTAGIDDVVLGCVEAVGEQGANIGRLAALHAGYDESVAGMQVNRFCASGLEAVGIAAAKVKAGDADLCVAGGVESMSRVPMGSGGGSWAIDPAVAWPTYFVPQGVSADLIATIDGYSRQDLDAFGVRSQQRAAAAWEQGWFDGSVVPVGDGLGGVILARDEIVRGDATVASLGRLKPSFKQMGEDFGFDAVALQRYPEIERIEHLHHAGNSSGIVDGASALLIGSEAAGHTIGRKARARIRVSASIGSEPCIMLTGPGAAARKALKRAGMSPGDIDLWEVNEAFAAVVLRFMRDLDLGPDNVNVAGGAIAMGHPLGATGGILVGTVLDELERRDLQTALIVLCVGAGMGSAAIIERV